MLPLALFGIGVVTAFILIIGFAVSVFDSAPRFWPHEERDWTFWVHHGAWLINIPVFVGVAYVDIGSLFAPGVLVLGLGFALIVVGLLITAVAAIQLGFATSTGMATELYTGGLYHYSRNPQIVGFIGFLVGVVLASGSIFALIIGVLDIVASLLATLAEEQWLTEQYNDAYERYRRRTPRFFGLPK